MTNEPLFAGVDIGTTHVKASVISDRGAVISEYRASSRLVDSNRPVDADRIFTATLTAVRAALASAGVGSAPLTLAVSTVSPVPVVFAPSAAPNGRPEALPYWRVPAIDSTLQGQPFLTNRLRHLASRHATTGGLAATDLCGYVVWRLTGEVTVNSVAVAEFGGSECFEGAARDAGILPARQHAPATPVGSLLVDVAGACGVPVATPCIAVAGSPDSFASFFAFEAIDAPEEVLYLGTFGSLARVRRPLHEAVFAPRLSELPYEWRLSCPGFGPWIESEARQITGAALPLSLAQFDAAALTATPGAEGWIACLPRWDRFGRTVGTFGYTNVLRDGGASSLTRSLRARAAMEGIGLAALAAGDLIAQQPHVHVCGGGATSAAWLRILADITGLRLSALRRPQGAFGTALLGLVQDQRINLGAVQRANAVFFDPAEGTVAASRDARAAGTAWYSALWTSTSGNRWFSRPV